MLKHSLALRLFIINFLFLILPTFIWLVFFFEKNRSENITEAIYLLQDRCYSRASRIEENINFHENILTMLTTEFNLSRDELIDKETLTSGLKKAITTVPAFDNLLYIKKTAGNNFVIWASTSYENGKEIDVTDQLFVTSAIQAGKSMTLGFDPNGTPVAFITKAIRGDAKNITGLLAFALDPEELLGSAENNQYDFIGDFTLLTKQGIVFGARDPIYRMWAGFPLTDEEIINLTNLGVYNPEKVKRAPVAFPINLPPFSNVYKVILATGNRIDLAWPINNSNAILMVGVNESQLHISFFRYLWKILAIAGLACVVSSTIIWILVKRLSQPFAQFIDVMDKMAVDNLTTARFLKDDVGYEINAVGETVNHMLDNLAKQIETIKNEPIKQKMVSEELQLGHQIQQQLLPQHLPALQACTLAATAMPALEVGGDFYDVFLEGSPKKLFIVVADGAGKGISACLFSLGLRSMLRSYAAVSGDVATTLRNANNLFTRDTEQSAMFATVFMALFDPEMRRLSYYSAGHPPALLKRQDGSIEKLSNEGMPIGINEINSLEQTTIDLHSGDSLLIYSDGVTEAMNPAGNLYGEEQLINFLKKAPQNTAQHTLDALLSDIQTFSAGAEQHDDITAVLIHIT